MELEMKKHNNSYRKVSIVSYEGMEYANIIFSPQAMAEADMSGVMVNEDGSGFIMEIDGSKLKKNSESISFILRGMGGFKAEDIKEISEILKRGNEMNYNKNSVEIELNKTLKRALTSGLVVKKDGFNGSKYENNTNSEVHQSQKLEESGVNILFPKIKGISTQINQQSDKMKDFILDIRNFNQKNTSEITHTQVKSIKTNLRTNKPFK